MCQDMSVSSGFVRLCDLCLRTLSWIDVSCRGDFVLFGCGAVGSGASDSKRERVASGGREFGREAAEGGRKKKQKVGRKRDGT